MGADRLRFEIAGRDGRHAFEQRHGFSLVAVRWIRGARVLVQTRYQGD